MTEQRSAPVAKPDRHVPDRRARVDVHEHARRTPPRTTSADRLHRADLVVRELDADQACLRPTASTTASGSTRPARSTPTTVTSTAAAVERVTHARVLDRGRHDVPAAGAGDTHDAVFTASVPDEVNTTSRGRAPKNAATCSRAFSSATASPGPRRAAGPGSP